MLKSLNKIVKEERKDISEKKESRTTSSYSNEFNGWNSS